MSALLVVQLLEVALNLATTLGINIAKLNAMRQLSADGHLTVAQIQELADNRDQAVSKL